MIHDGKPGMDSFTEGTLLHPAGCRFILTAEGIFGTLECPWMSPLLVKIVMITQTNWFDRKFNFDFPAGHFPCILERVRGTPARIKDMIQLYPRNILAVRTHGSWSIQEHVGHLFDLDELHDGRIDDFLAGAGTLRAADMTNRKTDMANHNATSIEAVLHAFRKARSHFVQRLENLDDRQIALVAEHPRLHQPMRLVDMAFFVAEHDDHHLARMSFLARTLQAKQ